MPGKSKKPKKTNKNEPSNKKKVLKAPKKATKKTTKKSDDLKLIYDEVNTQKKNLKAQSDKLELAAKINKVQQEELQELKKAFKNLSSKSFDGDLIDQWQKMQLRQLEYESQVESFKKALHQVTDVVKDLNYSVEEIQEYLTHLSDAFAEVGEVEEVSPEELQEEHTQPYEKTGESSSYKPKGEDTENDAQFQWEEPGVGEVSFDPNDLAEHIEETQPQEIPQKPEPIPNQEKPFIPDIPKEIQNLSYEEALHELDHVKRVINSLNASLDQLMLDSKRVQESEKHPYWGHIFKNLPVEKGPDSNAKRDKKINEIEASLVKLYELKEWLQRVADARRGYENL